MFTGGTPARFKAQSFIGSDLSGICVAHARPLRPCPDPHGREFVLQASAHLASWESSQTIKLCRGTSLSFRFFPNIFGFFLKLWVILGNDPYLAHTIYFMVPWTPPFLGGFLCMLTNNYGVDYMISKVTYLWTIVIEKRSKTRFRSFIFSKQNWNS